MRTLEELLFVNIRGSRDSGRREDGRVMELGDVSLHFLLSTVSLPRISPLPSVHHLTTNLLATPFCSPSFSRLPSVHHLTTNHLSTPFCSPSHRQPSLHSLLFTISPPTFSPLPSVHHPSLHSLLFNILLPSPFCLPSFSPLPSIHHPSLHSLLFTSLLSNPFCSPSHRQPSLHSLLFTISPPTFYPLPSVHHPSLHSLLFTNHLSTPFWSPSHHSLLFTISPLPSLHHLTAMLFSNPLFLRPHGRAVVVTSETYRLTAKEAYCEHPLEGAISIERTPHSFGERLVQWQTALICVRDNGQCALMIRRAEEHRTPLTSNIKTVSVLPPNCRHVS